MSDDSPTRTSDEPSTSRRGPASSAGDLSSGDVLAGRYRIVAPLGRGGMGEVYRADDLRLGQPVALKFLPAAVASDPARLARFINEVRVARQITHPNVCRVHDVDDADGRYFITMELVDGEDLQSLLRRIGRLPADKAVEITRQICAGLAVAHERGIVHRDLKPANVMLDSRGRARLADFGLAAYAEETTGEVAGTLRYMAPEQLAGHTLSARTDLFAVGALLFEMLTGKPAFTGKTTAELRAAHEASPPAPSSLVAGLDPALDRVVAWCLEPDPARRAPSALAVIAALGGQTDALAAAVAAGETPPPEMVAAAGQGEVLSIRTAWIALVIAVLGLPLTSALLEPLVIFRQASLTRSPEVLADRAADLVAAVSSGAAATDRAYDFAYTRAARAAVAGAPMPDEPIEFWYRQSPRRLDAFNAFGIVNPQDPPMTVPGMALVRLDTTGRLRELSMVPAGRRPPADPVPSLLAAAGLSTTVPPASERSAEGRAWLRVPHPGGVAEIELRDGEVVSFKADQQPGSEARQPSLGIGNQMFAAVQLTAMLVGAVLAWRNVRLGRVDAPGARRVAAFSFVVRLFAWAVEARHTTDLARELELIVFALSRAAYSAGLAWTLYVAVEPAIRRSWPHALISWTRLLAGRFTDRRVGGDVLVGVAAAVLMGLIFLAGRLLPTAWGGPAPLPVLADPHMLNGARAVVAVMALNAVSSIGGALIFMVMFVVLRAVIGGTVKPALVVLLIFTMAALFGAGVSTPLDVAAAMAVAVILLLLLIRYGFLSFAVATWVLGAGRLRVMPTLDLAQWYGEGSLTALVAGCAVAILAFAAVTRGRGLLPRTLAD